MMHLIHKKKLYTVQLVVEEGVWVATLEERGDIISQGGSLEDAVKSLLLLLDASEKFNGVIHRERGTSERIKP